jgi:hypothetical protein
MILKINVLESLLAVEKARIQGINSTLALSCAFLKWLKGTQSKNLYSQSFHNIEVGDYHWLMPVN